MTIEEKLRKTLQTKTGLKEVINNKGGTITDETPFEEYITQVDSIETGTAIEVLTEEEMEANLIEANKHKFYLYNGEDGQYTNGEYYAVVDDEETVEEEDRLNTFLKKRGVTQLFYNIAGTYDLRDVLPYNSTKGITNFTSMFYGAANIKYICLVDTTEATTMYGFVRNLENLLEFPNYNTSKCTNMDYMFDYCSKLTTIPLLDTKNVTTMSRMFSYCSSLTTIPQLDTSSCTNMKEMFKGCTSLTSVPPLNTSNVTDMTYMFDNCTSLTTIPQLDMNKVTSMSWFDMTKNCTALTNLTILNLRTHLNIRTNTSLTVDSLINTCKECINVGSVRTLTIGTANIEKLASVYVKFTNSTQTTIATNEKGEIEVCESTDTGAMLISEYMALKNWSIA